MGEKNEKIVTTRTELVLAYKKWNQEYKDSPEEFIETEESQSVNERAEGQVETLLGYLKK